MNKLIKHLQKRWQIYGLETLVVIVGILVAFSLDSWNENRKNELKERRILRELAQNLNQNIQVFEQNIKGQENFVRRIDIILDFLENDKPYEDSLAFHFRTLIYLEQITITASAYETLKSVGFDLIQSDDLRTEIIDLFGYTYPRSSNLVRDVALQRYSTKDLMMDKYFRVNKERTKSLPTDYPTLQQDHQFINWIYGIRAWKIGVIEQNQMLSESSKSLLENVNGYLEE